MSLKYEPIPGCWMHTADSGGRLLRLLRKERVRSAPEAHGLGFGVEGFEQAEAGLRFRVLGLGSRF